MPTVSQTGYYNLQALTSLGTLGVGMRLYTYETGTTTHKDAYTDAAGSVAQTYTSDGAGGEYIALDARGELPSPLYLTAGAYDLCLKTAAGATVWTRRADPTGADLAASAGSAAIGFLQSGTSAVARTAQAKMRDVVSVKDFGASPAASAAANVTAIAAALTYAGTKKCAVYIPGEATAYEVNDEFTVPDGVTVFGDGWGSFIQQTELNKDVFIAGNSNTFQNLRLKIADGDNSDFVNCIYASQVRNLTVEGCFLEPGEGGTGIHIRRVQNSVVRGNRIYGGTWAQLAGPDASSSDILLYSGGASERHIIDSNFCLSNNSQGIYVDALGYDGDIVVSNNVCVTLDVATCTEAGTWALAATGGTRRHGIIVGYTSSSVSGPRAVVTGNICRNTRWTGIYKQGVSAGAVVISGNLCDLNGYEASNTLAGGIYVTQSGNELVIGNTVTNFQNTTTGDTGAITVTSASAPAVPSTIRGNKIKGSAGYGIVIKLHAAFVVVDGNDISGCTAANIFCPMVAGQAGVGGHTITNNVITRDSVARGIDITIQSSTQYFLVKNNAIRGTDNSTNSTANTGIFRSGADSYVQIIGNEVSGFYFGVAGGNYWSGRYDDVQFERNTFINCNTGFSLGAANNNHTVPLVDNKFVGVTTRTAAALGGGVAGRIVQRMGARLQWETTAAPTVGSWVVGDRSANTTPAVGQPKGWLCTVTGTPGTWVSEGDL